MSNKTSTHKPDYTWLNQIVTIYQRTRCILSVLRLELPSDDYIEIIGTKKYPHIARTLLQSWRHVCGFWLVRVLSIFSSTPFKIETVEMVKEIDRKIAKNCTPQHAFRQVWLLEQEKQVLKPN